MTMPALLSHFGIDRARYVTTTGEIVFAGVTTTAVGGFAHVSKGAVTPMVAHAFHGDDDEPADLPAASEPWWSGGDQINRHVEAMRQCFPQFLYVAGDEKLAPCWIGEIDTGRGKFSVAIVLRRDRGLPSVAVVKGPRLGVSAGRAWIPSPHLFRNGNLCVASQDDWEPDGHTAATATAWAAHWLAAYTEWRIRRRWPVAGYQRAAS